MNYVLDNFDMFLCPHVGYFFMRPRPIGSRLPARDYNTSVLGLIIEPRPVEKCPCQFQPSPTRNPVSGNIISPSFQDSSCSQSIPYKQNVLQDRGYHKLYNVGPNLKPLQL